MSSQPAPVIPPQDHASQDSARSEPPASTAVTAPTVQTKRKRRSDAEIAADKVIKEQRRLARKKLRDERALAKRAKELDKELKRQRKEQEVARASRFFWTEGATAELLELMSSLKSEHDIADAASPGFISWAQFFKENSHRKSTYETLVNIPHDTLERRYKALLTAYRTVRDSCAATGGEGFHAQLEKYNLTEAIYTQVGELHESNAALHCVGGANPTQVSEDEAGAPVSPGSHAGLTGDDDGEGDDSFIPQSPTSDVSPSEASPGPEESGAGEDSPAPTARPTTTARSSRDAVPGCSSAGQRIGLPQKKKSKTDVPAGGASTPNRPPVRPAGSTTHSARSERNRSTKQAAEAAGRAEEAVDNGVGAMVLFQKEAAERAEREADREAKREERKARAEQARLEREERRERELEDRRRDERRKREERRAADHARYEHEEVRRAEERRADLELRAQDRQATQMMSMLMMRMMQRLMPDAPGEPQ